MINQQDLYDLAKCRWKEAKILLTNDRPDGAVYLCGYSLELIFKRHIAIVLNWDSFPETDNEFKKLGSFKTHDLDMLLRLSGLEKQIQSDNKRYANWQIASTWNSEMRYRRIGTISNNEAKDIMTATREILNFIYKIKT